MRLESLLVEPRRLALALQLGEALEQMLGLLCAVDHLFRGHVPGCRQRCTGSSPQKKGGGTRVLSHMGLKLGLNLGYWGIGPQGEDATEMVLAAERFGFDSVWAAESYGSDAVSVLAYLAAKTETIQLGAAILQVPARQPAAAAMAGVTIDALSGGRFIFGFGPSGPQVSEGWYGVPYEKPWGRTREYVEIVKQIVAREGRLEYRGKHFTLPLKEGDGVSGQGKALKLNVHPLRNEIPIYLGAIGRKSVELAAEVADGFQSLDRDGKREEAYAASPDELVDATAMIGTEDEVAELVKRFADAG